MNQFNESSNTMVITLNAILNAKKTVLHVSHDEEDGMWQFLDRSKALVTDNARIVILEEILKIDESLSSLWDLSRGWTAERVNAEALWSRYENT
ncbi:Uncharacterised protein [Lysinibacillus sphaericus]|nr:Uncharacterised protein [Lysinibacillus sphaericus]